MNRPATLWVLALAPPRLAYALGSALAVLGVRVAALAPPAGLPALAARQAAARAPARAAPAAGFSRTAPCTRRVRWSCRSCPPSPRSRIRRQSCATGRALRSSAHSTSPISHVAPILPAHLVQRAGDLPERADLDALHQ